MRALVTGAETPEGLAVIRALGRAGVEVIAAGDRRTSIGFASRYPLSRRRYTPVPVSPRRAVEDLLDIINRTDPDLVIPVGEDLLVTVNEARRQVTRHTVLAAPPAEVLGRSLDRAKTLSLAQRLGIPTPRWALGDTLSDLLEAAEQLRFPVAIRPRGPALHRPTAHTLDFAVEYAENPGSLARTLAPRQRDVRMTLVQECLTGVGHCVTAVCDQGKVIAQFACELEREYPLTGGVGVVRRSIPLDERLARATGQLLEAWAWHGVAMLEFRYDRREDEYTFVGVTPRFPPSTALALAAGLNLPLLVACLHAGTPLPEIGPARLGVRERWLRGDLLALKDGVSRPRPRAPAQVPYARASSLALWGTFLRDLFLRGRSPEFRLADPGPSVVEAVALLRITAAWARFAVTAALRRLGRSLKRQPPLPVQPGQERVLLPRLEIREEALVLGLEEHPGPGSGEFALSHRES